ncbi:LRRIQ4 [Branchiostoma lanceolatum]|uniref:LRRIQ4 protein n=1 Tax=Branchiostoma lanceolatum TaxID=7740 RepID=A0A8J9Z8K9_BRALA|nr:LRRIQ4 [Branchiostoma lanceolatum]
MEEKEQELRDAAGRGDKVRVQQLLAEGVYVNAEDSNELTALHFAAGNGHAETAQALLTAGADVNARSNFNFTPLHEAANDGHAECVKVLLKAGANTVIKEQFGNTAEERAKQEDVLHVFQLFKVSPKYTPLQPKVVSDLLTIDLSGKGLTSVPAEVFDAKNVERLVLSDNRLTSISEEIGQLQKLRDLQLDNNLLTQLPQAITTLPDLQHIDLSDNRLKEIPDVVCSLLQLKTLYVGSNPLKCLPDKISQLTGLRRLEIDSCRFDEFPRQVLQLEGLVRLRMANWAGEGKPSPVPEDIGRLKNLHTLYLDNSGLDSLPDGVGELGQLTHLDISRNRFTSVPEQIMNLPNIGELILNNNRISHLPLALNQLAQLYIIEIGGNPLTYPPPDVCEKGAAAIMDFLRREVKEKEDKELGKLFFRLSQKVTQRPEVEALAAVAGLKADERITILESRNQIPSFQAHNVLVKWMEKDREASMDKLQQELRDIGMGGLAEEVGRIKAERLKRPADASGGPPAKRQAAGGSSVGHKEEQQTKEKMKQAEQKLVQMQHHSETQQAMVNSLRAEVTRLTDKEERAQKVAEQRPRGQVGFPRASVPTEVEMGGPEMLVLYEKACKEGTTEVYHIRLILVGKHGNGKTSLTNSFLQLEFNKDEKSTDGIVIIPCLMTGKEQWQITEGTKDQQFAHAVGMEMKKMKEKEKPSAPKKTTGDKKPKEAPEVKPVLASSIDTDHTDHVDVPTVTKPSGERAARKQETTERRAGRSEDYALATRFAFGKDDLSKLVGSKEQPAMSIWDFAGHDVYYSSHHVFYSHYAIFILTLNLTKSLSDPLEPWDGSCAEALQLKTEADVVDYHLEAIQAHTMPSMSVGGLEENQEQGPPVIVVGTRKDQVKEEEIKDIFAKLRDHFRGKAIGKHVDDKYFAIDNTMRDPEDPELSDLRHHILKVAQQQNHMGRRIPISWLELKSKLMEMEKQGRKYCSLQDVINAIDSSRVPEGFTPEENAVIILRFFHLCGDILFFNTMELRNFVVLDPQWFLDVQKTIITIPQFRDPEVKGKWERLESTGVLEDSLIKHMWSSTKRQEELKCDLIKHKAELLKMMEQFDLVLKCSTESKDKAGGVTPSSESTTYFVPSLLTTVKDRERLHPKGTKCSKPIFVVFDDKFFPVGVYHRLVIASMRRYNKRKPLAYARCARFITSKKQTFVITKEAHYLKVELLSSEKEESACFSHGPSIRQYLDEDLREIINKWIPGIRYKWCLQCCCASHKERELDASSFIPITSVTEWFKDEEVDCDTFAAATTAIQDIGLAQWFQSPHAGQINRAMQQERSTVVHSSGEDIRRHFYFIKENVSVQWRDLAFFLGFRRPDIDTIQYKPANRDAKDCCMDMLEQWRRRRGDAATLQVLLQALTEAGLQDVVDQLNIM